MAAKWQQWMPLQIDKWRGSPAVRAMHPTARSGYLDLLIAQWQTEDCAISSDPMDLAELSGLGDELWEEYGRRILRNFASIEGGKLRNKVCFDEWQEARAVFEKRQLGGKNKQSTKTPEAVHVDSSKTDGADPTTGTLTGTETKEQEQKPSRRQAASDDGMKHSADPRHMEFKAAIGEYWDSKNPSVEMPWGPMEGKQLGMWLREAPHIDVETFKGFLRGRFKSEVNHGERPAQWIRWVTQYGTAVDRFNKPITETVNGKKSGVPGKGQLALEAARSAIDDLASDEISNAGNGAASGSRQGDIEVLRPQPVQLQPNRHLLGN